MRDPIKGLNLAIAAAALVVMFVIGFQLQRHYRVLAVEGEPGYDAFTIEDLNAIERGITPRQRLEQEQRRRDNPLENQLNKGVEQD